jgi:membrane protease subunit HflC
VQRIDRRLQLLDIPPIEILTRDASARSVDKTLTVDAYVTWKIPDTSAADRFIRAVGSLEQSERILVPQISSRIAAVIGSFDSQELISVVDDIEAERRSNTLHQALLSDDNTDTSFRDRIQDEYGIEIMDLRLRHFGYPDLVRSSIIERIRSERLKKVAEYESEGQKRAAEIISQAEKDAQKKLAEARAQQRILEGQADIEAERIRHEAYRQDPEFYVFIQKLQSYRDMFGSNNPDVLLLSIKQPLFDLLLNPPSQNPSK